MESVRVIIVDDHNIIRDALKNYFVNDELIKIVAEAINGKDALDKIKIHNPDVVLTDISMPVIDGHELTKTIKKQYPELKVIALTMINESQQIKRMLANGADGYLLKNCDRNELKNGISKVMNGDSYYSSSVIHQIMDGLANRESKKRMVIDMPLSSREKDVLRLIMKEYSNGEIADELFISVRTVDAHKRNLLEKTGSKNLVGLTIYAVEKGLV